MQFKSLSQPTQETQFFAQKPVLRMLIIGFLFITALGIRLYNINQPPLDFSPMRQLTAAHIARAYYFETMESIPEWRKQVSNINMQRIPKREPRIMEHAAVLGYRIAGGEQLWIPRVLSSIFWIVGGVFLYLIAGKVLSLDAVVFSTAFYLFLPFGISASRSFQPDPMMVMMLLFSLFMILSYYEKPSTVRLVIAATVSALAIFIKPVCIFLIFGTFVSFAIYRHGMNCTGWRSVISLNSLLFAVVSLLPSSIYYLDGIFIAGFLQGQAKYSIKPHLLISPSFWKDWLIMIGRVVGYIAFILALFGVRMFRQGLPKALMTGLWIGYFIFGMVFTYHIHTHDYYQLQFIPIVALSLGPIGALVINRLTNLVYKWWRIAVLGIILLTVILNISFSISKIQWKDIHSDSKGRLKILGSIIGINPQFIRFINPDFEKEVRIAQEIGEVVGHSTNTVFLDSKYGESLSYYGELSGLGWPKSSFLREWSGRRLQRSIRKLIGEELFTWNSGGYWIKGGQYSLEYFIVTDLGEFEEQADLRDFLTSNFPVVVQNDEYLIFDLRRLSVLDKQSEEQ